MAFARGFTLIELLIALMLAAAISIALVVAFRLGVGYLEQGRGYYSELQETLAVIGHLRRTVAKSPAGKLGGDDHTLRLSSGSQGFVCTEDDAGQWQLQTGNLPPDPKAKDAPQAATRPNAQPTAPTDAQTAPDKDKTPEKPLDTLLDSLDACRFEFLVAKQQAAAGLSDIKPTATPGKRADAPPADDPNASYAWQPALEQARAVAVRITLTTHHIAFPPIVLKPAG